MSFNFHRAYGFGCLNSPMGVAFGGGGAGALAGAGFTQGWGYRLRYLAKLRLCNVAATFYSVESLFLLMSSSSLLVVNQTYTKILLCFKRFFPQLSFKS